MAERPEEEQHQRHPSVPDQAMSILVPALKVGAFAGSSGILFGGVAGLIRTSTPVLFALASGAQWFALGSTFWATRSAIIQYYYPPNPNRKNRLWASTLAGGFTGGSIGGLIRNRSNILPGAFMFSIFGFGGQYIYNRLDAPDTTSPAAAEKLPFWQALANKKYSPMKVLTDKEYEKILREKLLHVDVEIALVDEKIKEWKEQDEEE